MFDHLKLFKDMENLFEEQRKLFKAVFDHWDQPFLPLDNKEERTQEVKKEKEEKCCCHKTKRHSSILTDEERRRFIEKMKARTKCRVIKKKSSPMDIFRQAITKVGQEENYQRCIVENMDKYAARVFSLINRDNEWDDDMKAIANVGIKIYFFAKLFFGGIRALDFYKYVLSIDPNFKKLVETKNDEKLRKYRAEALAQLIKKDNSDEVRYTCTKPIFETHKCNTTGRNRERNNGNYNSEVVLSCEDFSLRVSSLKNGGPRDGWFVELRKGEDEFAKVFNVSPSTKLSDMVNFVRSCNDECDED